MQAGKVVLLLRTENKQLEAAKLKKKMRCNWKIGGDILDKQKGRNTDKQRGVKS
jgi:hypothetical protein